MRGRPAPKRPLNPCLLVLVLDHVGLRLPLDAEWRIGQQVIELLAGQAVLGEAVAELDVLGVLALDHHVGTADGEGLVVVVLAEHLQAGVGIQLAQVLLRHAQHAARAAGRVVQRLHDALGAQNLGSRA